MSKYDNNNVFARIIRGELPARKIAENEHAISFHDIAPLAPVHVLVIPKLPVTSLHGFAAIVSPERAKGFTDVIGETIKTLGLEDKPYNIFSSIGAAAGQEVFHFHLHIVSGKPLRQIMHELALAEGLPS